MEFRDTLLAAQRNQQQKSSESQYYKAKFDPPKKEQKSKDKLSANIQKFLAKKDEEEKQKKLEAERKKQELLAMRDPKALRKIQKSLKVFKSANKSVIEDAIDNDNTAVTREGPDQPDQDDYGYESQEAAAIYAKMMQKYSKIPDEPKFPTANSSVKKDLKGTMERVKQALQHEDDPVPHKRRRKKENGDHEPSPPLNPEPERKKDEKPEKPKIRKPLPPPMDFNQLLKLAEQKKSEPLEVAQKKVSTEPESERLMTKRQKREYDEEMARRQRRQERIEAQKGGSKKIQKDDRPAERERKPEPSGFGRIPKIGDKIPKTSSIVRNNSPKLHDNKERDRHDRERGEKMRREKERAMLGREKAEREKERIMLEREKAECEKERAILEREKTVRKKERAMLEREKAEREKERLNRERLGRERLERLKAERERIDREMEMLSRGEILEKPKSKLESKPAERKPVEKPKFGSKEPVRQDMKKSIDLKSQNTYRIDKNSNERKVPIPGNNNGKYVNGHSSQGKPVPKPLPPKDGMKDRIAQMKQKPSDSSKFNGHVRQENGKRLPDSKGMSGIPKKPDDRRPQPGPSKPQMSANSFDFDKHVNSLKNGRQHPPGDVKRKPHPDDKRKPKRRLDSDSEYDSEMDDFIDDGDENMDYSRHIKEIFGYDKSKYRDMDDDDDPNMESSFVQQQREEYISKKHGIMEDLEDMRMEAMEKKKSKKKRRISDD